MVNGWSSSQVWSGHGNNLMDEEGAVAPVGGALDGAEVSGTRTQNLEAVHEADGDGGRRHSCT